MNIFNRILAIFVFFFLILVSSSLLLITTGALDPQQWVPTPWDQILIPFTQLDTSQGLLVVSICFGVSILSVLFLLIELRPTVAGVFGCSFVNGGVKTCHWGGAKAGQLIRVLASAVRA